jgi:hypothetical protein
VIQNKDSSTIIAEINAHMKASGVPNTGWNVGITCDVDDRLFGYHKVSRQNNCWIYRRAMNSEQARAIEAAYHRAGCKGGCGGGDHTATFVYAYVVTSNTVE